jgi:chloramphenicol 3-O phosphotransferase
MARSGAGVIVDEVFLGGAASQARLRSAFDGLDVLWVAVHCDPDVATAREANRPDRVGGMAALQAATVHQGVLYDLLVDTTRTTAMDCARLIAASVVA